MNTTVENQSAITAAIQKFKISEDTALALRNFFDPLEKQAQEWAEKANAIVVTDAAQTDLMKQAREARLALRRIRLDIAEKHSELKEESLRKGQILDLIKRTITGFIEPIEKHLQQQEDFAEVQEAKRKAKLKSDRIASLAPYRLPGDGLDQMPLEEMADTAFDLMLKGLKAAKEQREHEEQENQRIKAEQEQAAKAERERLEKENREKQAQIIAERERQQLITNRINAITSIGFVWLETQQIYASQAYAKSISLDEVKAMTKDEFQAFYNESKIEYNAHVKREQELRDKHDRAQRELRERQEKEDLERKLRQQAERKLKRAPDKVKLLAFAEKIELLERPELKDEDAKEAFNNALLMLAKAVKYIKQQAENL